MRATSAPSSTRAARAAKAARTRRTVHHAPSWGDRQATEAMAPRSSFIPNRLITHSGPQFEAPPKPPGQRFQPVGPAPKPKKRTYTPYERALGRPLQIDIKHQTRTQTGFSATPHQLKLEGLIDAHVHGGMSPRDLVGKMRRLSARDQRYVQQEATRRAGSGAGSGISHGIAQAAGYAYHHPGQTVRGIASLEKRALNAAMGYPNKDPRAAFGAEMHNARTAIHVGTGFDIHGRPSDWSVDPILGLHGTAALPLQAAMLPFAPLKLLRGGVVGVRALQEGAKLMDAAERARASLKEAGPLAKGLSAGKRKTLQAIIDKADAYQASVARQTDYATHSERVRLHKIIDKNVPETPKRGWTRQAYKDSFDREIIHQAHQAGEAPAQFLDRGIQGALRPIKGFDRTPQDLWNNLRRGPGGDLWDPAKGHVTTAKMFRAVGGRRVQVLGKMTPAARRRRAEAVMLARGLAPADLRDSAHWYESVHPAFGKQLAAKADEILRGFTVSQANQSPEGGLGTVLKVLEQIKAGVPVDQMEGGTKSLLKAIHTAVESKQVDKGMAAKLHDFADSIEGKGTRTWMGGFAFGGSPYAADVHMIRAHGGIDPKHVNQLLAPRAASLFKKGFTPQELGLTQKLDKNGKPVWEQVPKLDAKGKPILDKAGEPVTVDSTTPAWKTEFQGAPSDHQYWRMVEEGHAYANHLNEVGFLGKNDWTPAQAQAMDWAVSQWLHGVNPADLTSTFASNVRRFVAPATAKQLRKTVESVGGVVHEAEHGVVTAYTSPGMDAKIGNALAGRYGGATATWLSNFSQAKHRVLVVDELVPADVAHELQALGFSHIYGAAGETIFMASKQALTKKKFDAALDNLTARGLVARGEMTQAEHYGTAAEGQILGRRGIDRGVLGLPGAAEVGPAPGRVARAASTIGRTGSEGLGSGPILGRDLAAEGEHGLLPTAVKAVARRLKGEERGAIGPLQEPLPIHGPRTLEEEMAQRVQGQKPVRGRQEAGYRPQRAARFQAYEQAYAEAIGRGYDPIEASAIASRKLEGPLTKLESHAMEGMGEKEHQKMVARVHSVLTSSPERKRATDAINNAYQGVVPTRSEIALLERVFPQPEVEKLTELAHVQRSKLEKALDVLQIPRAIQSSFDISALMRQALPVMTRHPILWAEGVAPSIKAMRTQEQFDAFMKGIASDPHFAGAEEGGVQFTDVGHHGSYKKAEESYGSNLAEKIPGVSHSARQYTAFLNDTRLRMWKHLLPKTERLALKQAAKKGIDPEVALDKAHKDLARYINTMTGRGPMHGKLAGASALLNSLMFSPRLLASRGDLLLSPLTYARATPYVRRQAMRSMMQLTVAGTGVLVAASQIPGVQVGLNPLSADFGRIKIGDTRIDIWGGFQPLVRLLAQLKEGKIVSSTTGKVMNLNTSQFGGSTRLSIVMRFLREKLSPNASFVIDWLDGQDVVGNKFKWSQIWQRIVPMLATDIKDTIQYQGPHASPALVGGLGALGLSTMTYGNKKTVGKTPPGFRPSGFRSGGFRASHFTPAKP